MINEIDVVELKRDIPVASLRAGMRGTVVHVYKSNSERYEVEFLDQEGETLTLLTLSGEDLIKIWDAATSEYIQPIVTELS